MLTQRFFKVWLVGAIDEHVVKKLKEKLFEALSKGKRGIIFRFYISDADDRSYLEVMRPVLLENTVLSVLIEERQITDLQKDLADLSSGEEVVLLIGGRPLNLPNIPEDVSLRIEEVKDSA